jgi:hypothetical protein
MTVDSELFPDLSASTAVAFWPAPRERRNRRHDEANGEAGAAEREPTERLGRWPRVFPGL